MAALREKEASPNHYRFLLAAASLSVGPSLQPALPAGAASASGSPSSPGIREMLGETSGFEFGLSVAVLEGLGGKWSAGNTTHP